MELSIFLAKLIGIYLLIVAADLLIRRRELESAVRDFAASKGLLVCSGSLSLLLGLAIAIGHPLFVNDWRVIITLLGYFMILRGVVRIAFPSRLQKRLGTLFHRGHWAIFVILLVLGAYLTYSGFTT